MKLQGIGNMEVGGESQRHEVPKQGLDKVIEKPGLNRPGGWTPTERASTFSSDCAFLAPGQTHPVPLSAQLIIAFD